MVDNNIPYAINLFKRMLINEEMDDLPINGFSSRINISQMIDVEAWLGLLMLKSDEISVHLSGKRMWDVYYKVDYDVVGGIMPIESKNINEIDNFRDMTSAITTYDAFTIGEHNFLESYLYVRNAVIEGLYAVGEEYEIKSAKVSMYGENNEINNLNNGSILPFKNEKSIKATMLSICLSGWGASIESELAPSPTNDSSLDIM
jgi:hypothetical protein